MRIIRIDNDGQDTIINLAPFEFESCVNSEIGGEYRMVTGDDHLMFDGTILIFDRRDFSGLKPNPVASFLNLDAVSGRNIYGPAILAKLGKIDAVYGICDFEDQELKHLLTLIKETRDMIYG